MGGEGGGTTPVPCCTICFHRSFVTFAGVDLKYPLQQNEFHCKLVIHLINIPHKTKTKRSRKQTILCHVLDIRGLSKDTYMLLPRITRCFPPC